MALCALCSNSGRVRTAQPYLRASPKRPRSSRSRELLRMCPAPASRSPHFAPGERFSASAVPMPDGIQCQAGYHVGGIYCAGWDIGCVDIALPCGMQCCLISGNTSRHIAWRCTQRRTGQAKRDGRAGALCVRVRACVCVRGLGGGGVGRGGGTSWNCRLRAEIDRLTRERRAEEQDLAACVRPPAPNHSLTGVSAVSA